MPASDNLSPRQFHGLNSLAAELSKQGLSSTSITAEHAEPYDVELVRRSMKVVEDSKKTADDPFAGL